MILKSTILKSGLVPYIGYKSATLISTSFLCENSTLILYADHILGMFSCIKSSLPFLTDASLPSVNWNEVMAKSKQKQLEAKVICESSFAEGTSVHRTLMCLSWPFIPGLSKKTQWSASTYLFLTPYLVLREQNEPQWSCPAAARVGMGDSSVSENQVHSLGCQELLGRVPKMGLWGVGGVGASSAAGEVGLSLLGTACVSCTTKET